MANWNCARTATRGSTCRSGSSSRGDRLSTSSAGLPCAFKRQLQSEQRPPVVRMLPQILAVDAFGVGRPLRFEQRRAEPVPRRKRQRLGFVDVELIVQRHGALECGDGRRHVAGACGDLAFEDVDQHAEQAAAPGDAPEFVVAEEVSASLLRRSRCPRCGVGLAAAQLRVALREVPERPPESRAPGGS